jgi:Carboxypeptidase regulatory-like domain
MTRLIRALLWGTAAWLLFSGSIYGSSINVILACRSGPHCDARGVIILQSVANPSVVRRSNLDASSLVMTEQPGSEWEMRLDAKGFWALPQRIVLPLGNRQSQYAMAVWRTGTLQGQLQLPDPKPVALKVVVSSRPEPRVPPEIPRGTSFDCSTERNGQWKCAVPAALLDVAIRVEGYAPYHKWDVKIPIAGVVDLGAIRLQKGASVVAWLDSDFARRVAVPVRAALRYEAAPGASAAAIRLALPVAEGVFTKKGVVQLAPIAPGRYILETQAKGYAPARLPVQLYAGKETTPRRPIDLLPALSVRLLLRPPLGPGGIPWRVELWRKTDSGSGSQDAGSGNAARDGVFAATDQAEGPLHVYLKDSKQNILASRDIVIAPATAEYTIRVDVSPVSGTVTIGDSPLPSANLLFGGSGGAEKVRATTDRDGHFAVNLSRRGKWIVDIDAPQEAVAATTEISIEKDDVDISLPSTEVSGWVRDADGKRLPATQVTLFSSSGRSMVRTSESDGTFRFRGVQAGPATLAARDRRTHDYSKDTEVTIPDDGKIENVELTLESVRSIKGVVRSNGEVVVGALVHGYAFLAGSARQEQATTDLMGGFALDVPGSVTETVITVAAPGRTLESFSAPTNQDDPVALDLAGHGGTLRLRWAHGTLPLQFTFNDHFLASTDVFLWARGQGARIDDGSGEIPNVAPGKYRFCSANHCAEGLLAIGGQLELDVTR